MRAERPAALALILLVAAAVGLGLWAVGGPSQGRAEKRDSVRYQDLSSLERQVACLADTAGGALPAVLEETPECHMAERLADPYTGEPYRYDVLSETGYRLCAGFEAPRLVNAWGGRDIKFDRTAGCLVVHHASD